MKMTKAAKEARKQELKAAFANKIKTNTIKDVRKSAGDPYIEVKPEYVSITKWLRGAILGVWEDAEIEKAAFQKALGQDDSLRGGIFVPTVLSTDIIELLKDTAKVRTMPGVKVIPFKGTQMKWPAVDVGPTISWGGEAGTISEDTTLEFGSRTITKKKAVCLYKMSRELLDNASTPVDGIVKAEMSRELALEEDKVFLQGAGGTEPLGIYNYPRIVSTDLSGVIDADNIKDMIYQFDLATSSALEINGWVMHPRTINTLVQAKDANGRYMLPSLQGGGHGAVTVPNLHGAVVKKTTKIAITNRPSSNESYVVCGDWNQFLIGEDQTGLRIEVSEHENWTTDEISIRLVKYVGSLLRHQAAFGVIKGVQA